MSDWLDGLPRSEASRTKLLRRVELDNRVMRARRQGKTYEQIATLIRKGDENYPSVPDITATDVARACRAFLAKQAEEAAEDATEARQLELQRLDALVRRWQPIAENVNPDAAAHAEAATRLLLRISKRRAELQGLDAPKQHEVRVSGNILHELNASEDELEAEMRRRMAAGFVDTTAEELDA